MKTFAIRCDVCGRTKGRQDEDGNWIVHPTDTFKVSKKAPCCFGMFVAMVQP